MRFVLILFLLLRLSAPQTATAMAAQDLQQEMAGGLANIPQQAAEESPPDVPQSDVPPRDTRRINALPKERLSDAQLSAFLTKVRTGAERALPARVRSFRAGL
jgi:hypothetical protein